MYSPRASLPWRTPTPLPTNRQHTGQRQDEIPGLYDYRARYYDPALGRFIQPDTIVPEPGNPQALNRYAYVLNNPLRYNDPSGHAFSECGSEGGECVGGESPSPYSDGWPPNPTPAPSSTPADQTPLEDKNKPNDQSDWSWPLGWVNDRTWDAVPTAVGLHLGFSGQMGTGIEPGLAPAEILLLFNWRSGEVSLFYSSEAFVYLGAPNLLGGNVYGGWTEVKGLSENRFHEGPSLFGGFNGSGDAVGKLGIAVIGGAAIEPESATKGEIPPNFFIDPGSQRPITYYQVSIMIGGNLGANGLDAGILGGLSLSHQVWHIKIPYWPFRR